MNDLVIRAAERKDYVPIRSLLEEARLPILGVVDHLETYFVAKRKNDVVGAIGLELYGEDALLRSAVVTQAEQGNGIGSALVQEAMERAKSLNVRRLVLLTNTAEEFFQRIGFRKIERKSVTGDIEGSAEFTEACPSHAACMEMYL